MLLSDSSSGVQVNATPIQLGIRVLSHRDEIFLTGGASDFPSRFYFSTERLAHVEPFPGTDGSAICGRCKQPIERGDLAVRCPSANCGIWHHQTEHLGCWTYSDHCALCPTPTALDSGFRWTPEDL